MRLSALVSDQLREQPGKFKSLLLAEFYRVAAWLYGLDADAARRVEPDEHVTAGEFVNWQVRVSHTLSLRFQRVS